MIALGLVIGEVVIKNADIRCYFADIRSKKIDETPAALLFHFGTFVRYLQKVGNNHKISEYTLFNFKLSTNFTELIFSDSGQKYVS